MGKYYKVSDELRDRILDARGRRIMKGLGYKEVVVNTLERLKDSEVYYWDGKRAMRTSFRGLVRKYCPKVNGKPMYRGKRVYNVAIREGDGYFYRKDKARKLAKELGVGYKEFYVIEEYNGKDWDFVRYITEEEYWSGLILLEVMYSAAKENGMPRVYRRAK